MTQWLGLVLLCTQSWHDVVGSAIPVTEAVAQPVPRSEAAAFAASHHGAALGNARERRHTVLNASQGLQFRHRPSARGTPATWHEVLASSDPLNPFVAAAAHSDAFSAVQPSYTAPASAAPLPTQCADLQTQPLCAPLIRVKK
jgi:hypothetical protein